MTSLASSVARARCSALFTDGDARLEELRDLGGLPAQHLAEDEHGPLAGRELLERGDERELHRLARTDDLGRVAVGHDAAVRHRLDPELVGRAQVLDDRLAGRPEVHRTRAALAAVEHVVTDVRRDAVEPRAQRRTALEAVVRAPGADERLLHGILGVDRAEHPVAVAGELDAMLLELLLERRRERRGRLGHPAMLENERPDSASEQGEDAVADELDSAERRTALRRPELDAVGAGIPELDDARCNLLRRAGDAEALERGVSPGSSVGS